MTMFTISSTTVNRQHQQHRKTKLKEVRLGKRDVFIVSRHFIFSLVTAKGHKTPTVIDEARLMETLMSAHARRQLALRTICSRIHIHFDAHRSSLGTNSFVYEWMKYSESDATKDSFLSIQLESRPFDFLSILSCTSLSHVVGCSAWYRLSEFWKHHSSQPGRSSLSGCLNVDPEVRDVQQQLYSLHQQINTWLSLTLCKSMWKDFGIDFGEECFGSRQEKRPQELVWIDGGSSSDWK